MASHRPQPRIGGLSAVLLSLSLAGCLANPSAPPVSPERATTPALAPQDAPPPGVWHGQLLAAGVSASASSSLSGYAPERAIDGNTNTEWASGEYRGAEASLTLDLGALQAISGLAIKSAPLKGTAGYRIEVSRDGTSFAPVTERLQNTTWGLEAKAVPAGTQGRYVRLHFYNDASMPSDRFTVFEAMVSGSAGSPAPSPSATPTPAPSATPTPGASATPGPVSGTSASSSLAGYAPARAIDGDTNTQWTNGGFREATAWLAVDLGAIKPLGAIGLKIQPLKGEARYAIEVSNDGNSFVTAASGLNNTSWNLETKTLPAGTQGRYVRVRFTNDAANPTDRFAVFEVQTGSGPVPTPTPTATPTTAPSATPTPGASATPPPSAEVPIILPPDPGPNAARGRVVVNGAPAAGIAITLYRTTGGTISLTSDAQGYFYAANLSPGTYYAHYYNASDRNKIGYWRSRNKTVDGTRGAAFPQVDLYQKGMTNTPAMDAKVRLPVSFKWVNQTQPVLFYHFRLHDRPFTSYTLVYRSGRLPAGTDSFSWDGAGVSLSPTNRYFWGTYWDAGDVGEGGNLYQAIYFQ